jgi:hypothetical protein
MDDNPYTSAPPDFVWQHKASPWRCYLFGSDRGVIFHPSKGQEPNAFHRLMQRLILGFRWEKAND